MTPIEPVSVCDWAMILSAPMETQYPPEPATSDMETTTGFFFRVSSTSRQIASEATAEPPGLSTRKTTAEIEASSRAAWNHPATVSEPMVWGVPVPPWIAPWP